MTASSDVVTDTDSIDRHLDHIRRVTYDLEVRHETVTRLGAGLATAASTFLTAMRNADERGETINIGTYREVLEQAVAAYRTSEAGNFLPSEGPSGD